MEILKEGRHKHNSLDLSLEQSLPKDMTFAMDLICEVFYKCIIQFLTLTMVHKTYFTAVESLPCIFFPYKK